MKIIKYDKLVRDNIPERIEADGKQAVYDVVEGGTLLQYLNNKLEEELEEYKQSGEVEELADITEIIYSILDNNDVDLEGFDCLVETKRMVNGGFEKGIILKEVIEGEEE